MQIFGDNSRYSQDIDKLFNSEKFSDVKIVCCNETFFGHKNILAMRNDVFATMFDLTNSNENQNGVIQADYFDAKTIKTMLAFFYGNKIDNEKDLQSALSKLFLINMNGSYPSIMSKRLQRQIVTPNAHAQDIEKLFNSEKFSDVKIVCGNETFYCHKNILASRCDVFAAMFDMTNSTENQKGVVQVDDFDAMTMNTVLAYIYGNNIKRQNINMDLILAADKYILPDLVKCCEGYVMSSNHEKAFEIFLSSRLISKNIFNNALEVIQAEGTDATDFRSNKKWKKLKVEDPELAIKLLEELLATEPDSWQLICDTNSKWSHDVRPKIGSQIWDNPKVHAQDIEKMFNSEKFSDIKIVCGSETFFCHKIILACKSDVFATMFNMTDSIENQKGVVKVDDFDAKTMKTLLEYIYGNKIDKNDGDLDLLLAADKYNLLGLVKCCQRSIISEMSSNDALEALLSSRFISSKKLFVAAKMVIKREGAADITSTQNWNKLKVENPELAMELLEYCITYQDQYYMADDTSNDSDDDSY
jgi:hypothetical protein